MAAWVSRSTFNVASWIWPWSLLCTEFQKQADDMKYVQNPSAFSIFKPAEDYLWALISGQVC